MSTMAQVTILRATGSCMDVCSVLAPSKSRARAAARAALRAETSDMAGWRTMVAVGW